MKRALFLLALAPLFLCGHICEMIAQSPKIYTIKNFLSYEECDHLIALSRPYLETSYVVGDNGQVVLHPARKSESAFLTEGRSDRVVHAIEKRISQLVGIDSSHAEALQIVHYKVGEEYKAHYDTFDERMAPFLERGGQRIATFMIYLNTPDAGGETAFPYAGIKIEPRKGDALLFYLCLSNGKNDPKALHAGCPVLAGEKWIATRWFRQGIFK